VNWTLIVFKKEWREMLRDKRVKRAMIFGPVFSVALMMMLFGVIFSSVAKATKTNVSVVKGPRDPAVTAFLNALDKGGMKVVDVDSVEAAKKGIAKGDIRLALDFGSGMQEKLSKPEPFVLNAYFDPQEQKAEIALAVIEKATSMSSEGILRGILKEKGVDETFVKPLSVKRNEVKVGESNSSQFLVQLLPYFIVIWAFFGALSSASDIVSGAGNLAHLASTSKSNCDRKTNGVDCCFVDGNLDGSPFHLRHVLLEVGLLEADVRARVRINFIGSIGHHHNVAANLRTVWLDSVSDHLIRQEHAGGSDVFVASLDVRHHAGGL
jgi:hypothetical protein